MTTELNKLSDKKLKILHGRESDKIEFFADGAGLSAKASKVGGVSWVFTYRLDGKKLNRLTIGRYPDTSLKQAREARDKCRSWLASGKDPKLQLNLTMQESLKPVTVKEAIEYWVENYGRDNRTNIDRYVAQLKKHIYPDIGSMALTDCETRYWLKCFDKVKKKSPVAAGYIFQMCKQALKFCRVRKFAISNALDDLTIPDVGKKQKKGDRVLTDNELGQLWKSLNTDIYLPYYSNLLRILIVFGCRSQEVRLSKLPEWDFDSMLWTVPKENSKSGERITRPIPESLKPFLEKLIYQNHKSGYLLGELKKNVSVSQYGRNTWRRLGNVEKWTLHDLRRTLATKMNDMGIAPHVVEQLLGHALPGIMAIYNKSQYLPEKLDALNKWCERLDVLAGNYENVVILKTK
ncbi:tyrosine-type recombinase/integrase [Xenorhabdus bovienii]|uniref:tyrosine-type recombinase/integrase n=1 Tax=Xenorhabdus bovienii TaxID=40576 RepID=UPI00237CDAD0|nr:site-specific integrase [Xenorhabdus bovienii]MDE1476423.1 tyrosine-type recombinase/integrase [Xenorhabdus bovienii]MDE9456356.1 tyrosine-type recombinase/integrase [Xenorhabdus bovienii]MDE9484589.1 tyrosine-type recombinase/integrase [Xenorhabdus bovienii]MDE9497641.1 tyrosine-type recombinase/integrase [Xenorhabdus bovienii]MDE9512683.1 tyrosine-type recombinase/integrase [Xenorhabdus bovienii]